MTWHADNSEADVERRDRERYGDHRPTAALRHDGRWEAACSIHTDCTWAQSDARKVWAKRGDAVAEAASNLITNEHGPMEPTC